jgi:hypothetical protein
VSISQNPVGIRNLPIKGANGAEGLPVRLRWTCAGVIAGLMGACVLIFGQAVALHAQEPRSKLPVVSKLTTSKHQQIFSGKLQSLDMKQRILNVNSLNGQDSEIFPFKKNVRVEGINGNRLDLADLKAGSTVMIYFDQKSGERTIKNIVILSSGKDKAKGKPAPSS